MRRNILFSTTRQWNPGDEFILYGVLNIINHAFNNDYNPIIFNRNPDVRNGSKWRNLTRSRTATNKWDFFNFKGKGILQETLRIGQFDNSCKDDVDSSIIDLAVFAGSPEWHSNRLIPMYKIIERGKIPTLFLGIGAGDDVGLSMAPPMMSRIIENASLITVRDVNTAQLLKKYNAMYMPCPALLSATGQKIVSDVNRIGLIYATDNTVLGHKVSPELHEYIIKLYREIAKVYHVGVVCHYIDEIEQARKELPDIDLFYSFDSRDYENIYKNFDIVLGGRVHGIGISASLSIPGIMIKHDKRSSTTDGFLAKSISIGTSYQDVLQTLEKICSNIQDYSQKLRDHKRDTLVQYGNLLNNLEDIRKIFIK